MPLCKEKCFPLSHHSDDMCDEKVPGPEKPMRIQSWEKVWKTNFSASSDKKSSRGF